MAACFSSCLVGFGVGDLSVWLWDTGRRVEWVGTMVSGLECFCTAFTLVDRDFVEIDTLFHLGIGTSIN